MKQHLKVAMPVGQKGTRSTGHSPVPSQGPKTKGSQKQSTAIAYNKLQKGK